MLFGSRLAQHLPGRNEKALMDCVRLHAAEGLQLLDAAHWHPSPEAEPEHLPGDHQRCGAQAAAEPAAALASPAARAMWAHPSCSTNQDLLVKLAATSSIVQSMTTQALKCCTLQSVLSKSTRGVSSLQPPHLCFREHLCMAFLAAEPSSLGIAKQLLPRTCASLDVLLVTTANPLARPAARDVPRLRCNSSGLASAVAWEPLFGTENRLNSSRFRRLAAGSEAATLLGGAAADAADGCWPASAPACAEEACSAAASASAAPLSSQRRVCSPRSGFASYEWQEHVRCC